MKLRMCRVVETEMKRKNLVEFGNNANNNAETQ